MQDGISAHALHMPCEFEDPGLEETVEALEKLQSNQVSMQQVFFLI